MSIVVAFGTFSKRKNSTKRIPTSSLISFNCNLKEPCTVLNPVIELSTNTNMRQYNVAKIGDFDRYYFISDWEQDHGRWIAHMAVDVLASWRTSIFTSTQYVLRSASSYDTYIADSFYPGTLKKTYSHHDFTGDEKCFMQDLTYVIGVMNGIANAPRIGGVTYYILTAAQIQSLMNALLGNADYLGDNGTFPTLFGITKEVMQALVNPTQYMVDSFCLPYAIPSESGSLVVDGVNFTIGWWALPGFTGTVKALMPANMVYRNVIYGQDVDLEYHPQHITRGSYVNGAPFTQITLYAGPFGEMQIDTNMLVYGDTAIHFQVSADFMGNCELLVTGKNSGCLLARRNAIVKIPFKIGQMFQDRIEMAKNALQQAVGGFGAGISLVGGNVGGMGGYGGTVLDSLQTSMPKVSMVGDTGSLFNVNRAWRIDYEFTHLVDDDVTANGRPLCQEKVLNTLSGYTVVQDPDIEFGCYADEYDQIASYMTSGFFLE